MLHSHKAQDLLAVIGGIGSTVLANIETVTTWLNAGVAGGTLILICIRIGVWVWRFWRRRLDEGEVEGP